MKMKTKTYPRLERALKLAGCLTQTEVDAAIRNWRVCRDIYSGEAANHFGGFLCLVQSARQLQRAINKGVGR